MFIKVDVTAYYTLVRSFYYLPTAARLMRAGAGKMTKLEACGDEKRITEVGHQGTQTNVHSFCIYQNTTKLGHWPL